MNDRTGAVNLAQPQTPALQTIGGLPVAPPVDMTQAPPSAPRGGRLSLLALVFGLLAFPVTLVFIPPLAAFGAGAVLGPIAVLLAIFGLRVGRHEAGAGRAMAIIGLIFGAVGFAYGALTLAAALMDSTG